MSPATLIRFSIAPIFFFLALVNASAERAGLGHAAHQMPAHQTDLHETAGAMDHSGAHLGHSGEMGQSAPAITTRVYILGIAVPAGLAGWLTSMSLMYWLMGLAHITPWLGLIGRPKVADY